jgi:hypothetical protein
MATLCLALTALLPGTSGPVVAAEGEVAPRPASSAGGAPIYAHGDTWRYTRGCWTVTAADEGRVAMRFVRPPCTSRRGNEYVFDRNLTLLQVLTADGAPADLRKFRVIQVGPEWKYYDFPLTPGKRWRISGQGLVQGETVGYVVDLEVKAWETVKTTAGAFEAWKIERNWFQPSHFGGGEQKWVQHVWWAPAVKNVVKFSSLASWDTEWELVSYQLASSP